MNKRIATCKLHNLLDYYLLGPGRWPADGEALSAISTLVQELHLSELVSGPSRASLNTTLGKELRLDLILAFVGAWHLWEIPSVLEQHGYIEELEVEEILCEPRLEVAEKKLRQCVSTAYLRFCNVTPHMH